MSHIDSTSTIRRLLFLPTAVAVGGAFLFAGFALLSDSENFHGHAIFHWGLAIPALFVGLLMARLPEARTAPRRIASLFPIVALIGLAVSQVLEGAGAFATWFAGGFEATLEFAHGLGEGGTLLSMFVLPLGVVILFLVYLSVGIRALVSRRPQTNG